MDILLWFVIESLTSQAIDSAIEASQVHPYAQVEAELAAKASAPVALEVTEVPTQEE